MNIRIKELDLKNIEFIFSLYGQAYGDEKLKIWMKRWEWEFVKNPRTEFTPSRMWVAESRDNKILGFIASFPMLLKVGERKIITSSSGDLSVLKEGRGKGIAKLLSKAYRDSNEVLVTDGFGYQPITGHIYRRLGYHCVSIEPIYVRPMNSISIFRFLLYSGCMPGISTARPLIKFIENICSVFNRGLLFLDKLLWPKISKNILVQEAKEAGTEFDTLWENISHHFPICFVRDKKFIQWRFFDDPIIKHTIIVARKLDRELVGYLTLCFSEKGKMLVGHIMDIFCLPSSVKTIDSLLNRALEIMKKRGVDIISCMGTHPLIRKRIKKYLYLRAKNFEIPALLLCKDNKIKDLIYDRNKWHLTKADGDEGFYP